VGVLVGLGACASGPTGTDLPARQVFKPVTAFGRTFQSSTMGQPHSVTIDGGTAHFEVRPGERYYRTDGRQRSELSECPRRSRLLTAPMRASFAFRVRGPVKGDAPNDYTIVWQVHQDRVPGVERVGKPPSLSIGFNANGRFAIAVRGDTHVPSSAKTRVYTQLYAEDWTRDGQWISLSYEADFGPTGNGSLRLWMDGRMIIDRQGLTFGYSSPTKPNRPQIQFGIYRSRFSTPLSVDYRDVVIDDPPAGSGC
jgi:hypothetical protein